MNLNIFPRSKFLLGYSPSTHSYKKVILTQGNTRSFFGRLWKSITGTDSKNKHWKDPIKEGAVPKSNSEANKSEGRDHASEKQAVGVIGEMNTRSNPHDNTAAVSQTQNNTVPRLEKQSAYHRCGVPHFSKLSSAQLESISREAQQQTVQPESLSRKRKRQIATPGSVLSGGIHQPLQPESLLHDKKQQIAQRLDVLSTEKQQPLQPDSVQHEGKQHYVQPVSEHSHVKRHVVQLSVVPRDGKQQHVQPFGVFPEEKQQVVLHDGVSRDGKQQPIKPYSDDTKQQPVQHESALHERTQTTSGDKKRTTEKLHNDKRNLNATIAPTTKPSTITPYHWKQELGNLNKGVCLWSMEPGQAMTAAYVRKPKALNALYRGKQQLSQTRPQTFLPMTLSSQQSSATSKPRSGGHAKETNELEHRLACLKKYCGVPSEGTRPPPMRDVPGLSSAVLAVPDGEVGPGASKTGEYKNPEYFSYNKMSYFEAEIEMLKYRLPQPSSKSNQS